MGRNTIHSHTNDLILAYDKTQGFWFKFQLEDKITLRKATNAGLNAKESSLIITVNGQCAIALKDVIVFNGTTMTVNQIQSQFDNQLEAKLRNDLENFTGTTWVGFI